MAECAPLLENDSAHLIVQQAFSIIDARYGPEGRNPKEYHNLLHTLGVVQAASDIADLAIADGKIAPEDKRLVMIAAAWHDTEQDLGSGPNEEESTASALIAMRAVGGFSDRDEQLVSAMIMATQVHFDEEGKMSQSAITETSHDTDLYLTKILADADLSNLGKTTEEYLVGLSGFFQEMNPSVNVDSLQGLKVLQSQVPFLQNHTFYTPEAAQLFPNKADNILYAKHLVNLAAPQTQDALRIDG